MKRKSLDSLGQDGGGAHLEAVHTGAREASQPPSTADVVVIGGGPAGASAGRLLSAWGHRVVLVDSGPSEDRPLWETLPPSCRKPLSALGLLGVVQGAGFDPTIGNRVAWAGRPVHDVDFGEGGTGWQAERGQLAGVLLDAAAAAGARVIRGTVTDVHPPDPDGQERRVEWEGGPSGGIRARWVLDASGRAGVVARRGIRRRAPGPATLALIAEWSGLDDGSHAQGGRTLVESYADGWAWSIPTGISTRMVAVIVDPRASRMRRGEGLDITYLSELGKTEHHRMLPDHASLKTAVWACSATPYDALAYGIPGCLLLGDAGSFLDPLSSFGVKKALASAWLAAVVVNTALRAPDDVEAAIELFNERERSTRTTYAARAAEYYREAAEFHGTEFWTERASTQEAPAVTGSLDEPTSETLLRHPELRASLQRIRKAERLVIRADAFEMDQRPVVEENLVVRRRHLVPNSTGTAIRMLQGVELPRLIDLVSEHDQVPEIYEAARRRNAEMEMAELLAALSLLVAVEVVAPVPA